jgi:diaminopimelate epimerase
MNITKYSANGNDFVIFHAFLPKDRSELAKELCNRQNGIGADGLIVLLPHAKLDFAWEFYNADGSVAEMCGNGSRACAHYAYTNGLAGSNMAFATLAGTICAHVEDTMVTSELTPPKIIDIDIQEDGKRWWKIDTGVPHLVTFDSDIAHFDIEKARMLRHKYNANVNIATLQKEGLHVRTYERGVENETLACGTGMAAVFYRAQQEGLVEQRTKVFPKSGDTLYFDLKKDTITFSGAVTAVFHTAYTPKATL